jgi:hypothetical protein
VALFGGRTVVSIGDLLQYAGLFLLIQGLVLQGGVRRPKLKPLSSPWATLLRVDWLAILLGLLLQLALLLAVGFDTAAGVDPCWRRPARPCAGR